MRPLRLRMAAFGPFAGEEAINFSELGENPLFLINGPTGSGKSTILDAICFALYGETTGNEREAKQMRCDTADPAILTEVTLEFALASGRYRITRVPDQFRPKARGDGFTEQKARAELYKLEGDQEKLIVAPKITEATSEIVNLTGLSAEQFRQVMVLPQGKFRDLLLAKSEEREIIFQQLFQTHVYSTLQNKLREQANNLSAQLKEIQLQQKAVLEAIDIEGSEQLQAELNSVSAHTKMLVEQQENAQNSLAKIQAELQEAKQLESVFVEYEKAQALCAELDAKQRDIEQQKKILVKAKNAREIEPLFLDRQKQLEAKDKAVEQVRQYQMALAEANSILQINDNEFKKLPDKELGLDKKNASIIELESFRKRSEQLLQSMNALGQAELAYAESQQVTIDAQNQLDATKNALAEMEKDYQVQSKAIVELPEKKNNLEKVEEQGKSIRKVNDLQLAISALNKEILNLGQEEKKLQEAYQQKVREKDIYEMAWQKGQAAFLAANLADDQACPVCGSTDHPDLAQSSDKLPTEYELENVRKDVEAARGHFEKVSREKLLKEEESRNLIQRIEEEKSKKMNDSDLTLDSIRALYKSINDELEGLKKIADSLPGVQVQIDKKRSLIQDLEKKLSEVRQQEMEKGRILAACQSDVKNKQAELPEQFQNAVVLDKALQEACIERDKLKQEIDHTTKSFQQAREAVVSAETALKNAQDSQRSLEEQCIKAETAWQKTLSESVFDNLEVYIQSKMDKQAEDDLEKEIRQFEDQVLVAQNQFEEKKTAISEKQRPDLQQLTEMENESIDAKNQVDAEFHQYQQRYQMLATSQEKLKKSILQQAELEKEFGIIGKLSDISNGRNPHNLSLQRFVLSVLLDDVLTEASYRLNKMSKGRYQLYRKDTVGDKRTKSGLELEVEDAYTGKQRPAATLSGGESFMAALALALGLSDVVQSYAGGIRLDTLFIDEGFGSLDPESLELAINTLMDLRATGRMIGVISHVEEMKRIIDIRLDVHADRGVSRISLTGT